MATQWHLNLRFLPGVERAARYRFTLDYRFDPKVTIGLEANGLDQLLPRLTWFVTPATQSMPSVVAGITGDRLSTPTGQAMFVTFSKSINDVVTPFVGLKYGLDQQAVAFPFGANFSLGQSTFQALYDGNGTHLILTQSAKGINYSFMLARMRFPGIGISYGF